MNPVIPLPVAVPYSIVLLVATMFASTVLIAIPLMSPDPLLLLTSAYRYTVYVPAPVIVVAVPIADSLVDNCSTRSPWAADGHHAPNAADTASNVAHTDRLVIVLLIGPPLLTCSRRVNGLVERFVVVVVLLIANPLSLKGLCTNPYDYGPADALHSPRHPDGSTAGGAGTDCSHHAAQRTDSRRRRIAPHANPANPPSASNASVVGSGTTVTADTDPPVF